uniref:CARD domain-containing protein n=1 Tax=Poecilia latipinna TaxID=48699 RepID=A0A3B3VXF4_9TELE
MTQLLDDLETDRVLIRLEKRAIIRGNPIITDKARNTIDTVRMKGQRACRLMIKSLHLRDPTLSNQLGLSSLSPVKGETHSSLNLLLQPLVPLIKL